MGSKYSTTVAVDLTPDAWTFSDDSDAQKFSQEHNFGDPINFSLFKAEVKKVLVAYIKN